MTGKKGSLGLWPSFGKFKSLIARHLDRRIIFVLDTAISFLATLLVIALLGAPCIANSLCESAKSYYYLILITSLMASALMFAMVKSHYVIIRHMSLRDVGKIAFALLGKEICIVLVLVSASMWRRLTLVIVASDFLLSFFLLTAMRVTMIFLYRYYLNAAKKGMKLKRVLVFDSDSKSVSLFTRLQHSTVYDVVGFITVDPADRNLRFEDLKVMYFDDEDDFKAISDKYMAEAVLFSSENIVRDEHERTVKYALENGLKVLVVPTFEETGSGDVSSRIREVKVEDLLGRDEIRISLDKIIDNFSGKTVMVTGAAGSIGSELCRQLAGFGVRKLILFDNSETPMHNLRLCLEENFPKLDFVPVIGDVRHAERLDFAFGTYRPQIVFHAAAYKHVPLMEENPCEAVLVNVFGTHMIANKCIEYGIDKMVMISTDKAVNPTNIMGCSKRLAEIYVQSLGKAIEDGRAEGRTRFVTTRFGNVLGSNGSVIPRFRDQIAAGGPVTVTHPEITRFFMTIPEACRLVMEAATMSSGNEIYVFDMGKSVKIDTLARRMIELSGLRPDVDIQIQYTGLRPGEKLYEEVLADLEGTLPTSHDRIRVASIRPYEYNEVCSVIDRLVQLARNISIIDMVRLMKETVPEYKSRNSVYEALDKTA